MKNKPSPSRAEKAGGFVIHRLSPAELKAKGHAPRVTKSLNGKAAVDATRLAPFRSSDEPEFLKRGYYRDKHFTCRDCGLPQVWTAARQKWWYEIARGGVFTQAIRCLKCRRKKRERS